MRQCYSEVQPYEKNVKEASQGSSEYKTQSIKTREVDLQDKLIKLKELRKDGVISDHEFQLRRKSFNKKEKQV